MTNIELTIIETNIKAQQTNKSIAPLCIAGEPGTAKSTTVEILAKKLGMNIVSESAPTMTHEILSGLPDTVDTPEFQFSSIDGSVPKSTLWSIPEMMAKALRAAKDKPTVLLIDDFHMVSPHLQAYFYGLLLERRLGNYKLSDNVSIILTMNDSEAAGFNGINSAVRNRMSILSVKFNFEYWFNAFGNRLHYLVSSFLKAKPHFAQEEESVGIEGYATARAWTAIANELHFYDEDFIKSNAGAIAGMQVSAAAAQAFQAHVLYVAAIDFTKLVKSKQLVDLATKDPLDSIIYAYITNFISTVEDGTYLIDLMDANKHENSSAFIGFTLGELFIKFQDEDTTGLSEGLRFVIDILLDRKSDSKLYPNTSTEKLKKAFEKKVVHLDTFRLRASEYII